ncbi:MAG: UvrD-helicase domain-containing protein [Candidatus Andersenbacteria bacterium]
MATTPFATKYRTLNPEQRRAVDAIEGVVIVLAGPGTGKTQVLAMRIAKILQETQMDPHNILCLTFTESGVAAMRKRLISIIGTAAYYVRIHTFHSFCNEVIQENAEKFTFARELEVLSEIERVELFREIIDTLPAQSPLKPFGNPYLFLPDIVSNIQSLKQEHISPPDYKQALNDLEKLVSKLKPSVAPFLKVTASDRSVVQCEKIYQTIIKTKSTVPAIATNFVRLEKLHTAFTEHLAEAPDKRSQGKLLTKFKNDLKRWYENVANRLPKQQALHTVYVQYQEELNKRGRYDYEDMILFVIDKFKTDDELLARYQEQFQYILVDEYQDTNGAQNETVSLLGAWHENPNIFVVGDDKQSIYRFQGASLENLLYLYERYKDVAEVIVLQANYRSQQTILDAASALIVHNQESIERYLPGAKQDLRATGKRQAAPVKIVTYDSLASEWYGVGTTIKSLIKTGTPPQEIAVLYRRNADAAEIADTLFKLNIPLQIESGENVLDDPTTHQLLDVISYVAEPRRHDLLWKILHYSFFNIAASDLVKLQAYAAHAKKDLITIITSEDESNAAKLAQVSSLQAIAHKLAHWQVVATNKPLPDVLAHVLQESGLFGKVSAAHDHLEVLNRLTVLFNEARHLYRHNRHVTLAEFVEYLNLLKEHGLTLTAQRLQTKAAAVRLMTAHKAKGLEFEQVFMVQAVDHHWGNLRERNMVPLPQGLLHHDRIAGEENNEDERRLFYVAMTRAKQGLTISHAARGATGREQVPAIFIEEIPTRYVAMHSEVEVAPNTLQQLQTISLSPQPPPPDTRLTNFLQGLTEQYVLSVTHLNNYLTCPRLFYYRNLLRVPEVKSAFQAFGTAIHAALYEYYALSSAKQLPPPTVLLDSFSRHLKQEVLDEIEFKNSLERGEQLLTAYLDHYADNSCRQNLLEYNFSSHGVTVDDIPITGQIDKIEIVDPARQLVNVVDYKTGNPDTKKRHVKRGGNYHRQLVFYKLLCDNSPRFAYTMNSGEIDFIEASAKTEEFIKPRVTVTDADLQELRATISKVWQDIQSLRFIDPNNPDFCGDCVFCKIAAQGHIH